MKLQALIDRKKVIITEDTIRQNLRLDDVDGLPNKEIFVELARMRYEKSSIKLTFYKEFFSAQWKQDCSSFRDYQAQVESQEVREEEETQVFRVKEVKE
nr:hypothetical protein [Tanacetum cinerariifolium]